MEKDLRLIASAALPEKRSLVAAERAALGRVRRVLAELHLPCKCQDEIDTVLAKLDDWESRRLRQQLVNDVRQSIEQMLASFDFVEDIAATTGPTIDSATCREHAETLRFLGETANSAALILDAIADMGGEAGHEDAPAAKD